MKFKHPQDINHANQDNFGRIIYEEVIKRDTYGIRDFFKSDIARRTKSVVDVGANIGSFSLMASVLFPSAQRLAIEPQPQNFELLQENMLSLECLCMNMAIGDGHSLVLDADWRFSGSDSFKQDQNGTIQTMPLSAILSAHNIPTEGLVLKVDCEGGEYHFVDDYNLQPYLRGCIWFACEFHEGHLGGMNTLARWDKWFDTNFGQGYLVTKERVGVDMGKILWNYKAIKT
jgi:FkbM family methyltransferase